MKIRPGCLPCLLHQALQVARSAAEDEWSQRKVLTGVLKSMPETDWNASPAEILAQTIAHARTTLGVSDPYADARTQAQKQFATLAESFRSQIEQAADPFAMAVVGAAAANVADELIFARFSRDADVKGIFETAVAAGFASGSPDQLREAVDQAECILYLLDNAGEVYFDALLIERIRALGKRVVVATRGEGLLHDATVTEVSQVGLNPEEPASSEEELEPLPESAPEGSSNLPELIEMPPGQLSVPRVARSTILGAAVDASQLVIAKGSAHYETFKADTHDVVFLLRAKCPPVAHSLGVSPGSLVLLRVKPTPPLPTS